MEAVEQEEMLSCALCGSEYEEWELDKDNVCPACQIAEEEVEEVDVCYVAKQWMEDNL